MKVGLGVNFSLCVLVVKRVVHGTVAVLAETFYVYCLVRTRLAGASIFLVLQLTFGLRLSIETTAL